MVCDNIRTSLALLSEANFRFYTDLTEVIRWDFVFFREEVVEAASIPYMLSQTERKWHGPAHSDTRAGIHLRGDSAGPVSHPMLERRMPPS